jgi:hypothetical protein
MQFSSRLPAPPPLLTTTLKPEYCFCPVSTVLLRTRDADHLKSVLTGALVLCPSSRRTEHKSARSPERSDGMYNRLSVSAGDKSRKNRCRFASCSDILLILTFFLTWRTRTHARTYCTYPVFFVWECAVKVVVSVRLSVRMPATYSPVCFSGRLTDCWPRAWNSEALVVSFNVIVYEIPATGRRKKYVSSQRHTI